MNIILFLIIALVTVLIFVVVYKQLEGKKRYTNALYLQSLGRIAIFFELVNSFSDYVTWVERDIIKVEFSDIGKFFRNKTNYYKKEPIVGRFNEVYHDFDAYIARYNQNYVKAQKIKLKEYFDNVECKMLDDQQRTALITDEYSNLILAGAGSGKTLTILGKVKYLIEQKGVDPKNILLLSFTKKTVEELNERLQNIELGTKATTFHKLGYDIIKKHHQYIPVLTNDNTLKLVIEEYLKKDIFNNPTALQSYIEYIACYMNIPEKDENLGLSSRLLLNRI